MKTAGIICEYNPFHLGHLRQVHLIREQFGADCAIIGIMSGNYVQRGMPAMWDKFTRAKAALSCGVDLILELPITGVLQSAEGFASTGVDILSRLACVEYLCFGVEHGNEGTYLSLAKQVDGDDFRQALRENLDAGLPYAAARQKALGDNTDFLTAPNNILALEYCSAILKKNSPLRPFTVTRNGNYHDPIPQMQAPSASGIRNLYPHGEWKRFVPAAAAKVLETAAWYHLPFGERAVLARLRTLEDDQWEACAHGSEGLFRKAMKAARTQDDFEAVVAAVKSKRYPRTRIQRFLMCAYLGISDADLKKPVPYVRVLGANETGRNLLRRAKDIGDLPLINAGETPQDPYFYQLEQRAARLYTLFAAPNNSMTATSEERGRIILI